VFSHNDRKLEDKLNLRFHRPIARVGKSPKLNFHSTCHTHGTWLVQAKVSTYHVSKMLGHSSAMVTQKHYASLVWIKMLARAPRN